MGFEIQVVENRSLKDLENPEDVALELLRQIGYISCGNEPAEDVKKGIPFRLFMDCFLRRMDKAWTADELAIYLETTKPTVYRHIAKLKNLDLLEASSITDEEGKPKKGYKLRYGDLARAWGLVEAHVELAMQNYRRNVDHLQKMLEK
ncbi:MAG: HTH domain-containing protein [Candidatus Thermoplasmatota archaeon]|nr:HTH domain-containing protein [Candidatus Thermoplasmatota archaeon]